MHKRPLNLGLVIEIERMYTYPAQRGPVGPGWPGLPLVHNDSHPSVRQSGFRLPRRTCRPWGIKVNGRQGCQRSHALAPKTVAGGLDDLLYGP